MRIYSAGRTDIGRRRSVNEDAFLCDEELSLYVVADGMGGHAAGEVASQEAVEAIQGMVARERHRLDRLAAGDCSDDAVRGALRLMESAVQAATYMIFGLAQHQPERQGMGTTVSALAICGGHAITGQVGDSRIYRLRNGEAMAITEDHTLVAWQLKQGIISEKEAAISPHRNVITRAVGSREYVQVDTGIVDIQVGDAFLLCSDGLHGYLRPAEIPANLVLDPETATEKLVSVANERGGRDNITAIVVQIRA